MTDKIKTKLNQIKAKLDPYVEEIDASSRIDMSFENETSKEKFDFIVQTIKEAILEHQDVHKKYLFMKELMSKNNSILSLHAIAFHEAVCLVEYDDELMSTLSKKQQDDLRKFHKFLHKELKKINKED